MTSAAGYRELIESRWGGVVEPRFTKRRQLGALYQALARLDPPLDWGLMAPRLARFGGPIVVRVGSDVPEGYAAWASLSPPEVVIRPGAAARLRRQPRFTRLRWLLAHELSHHFEYWVIRDDPVRLARVQAALCTHDPRHEWRDGPYNDRGMEAFAWALPLLYSRRGRPSLYSYSRHGEHLSEGALTRLKTVVDAVLAGEA